MKTTNNVQKTNLKSVVFAAGLIVIGFSVDGQGATKTTLTMDNDNQFAFANTKMVSATTNSTEKGATASFAAYFAPEAEEALTLEKWMTEESIYDVLGAALEPVAEEELTLESWMTEELYSGTTKKTEATEKIYIIEKGKTKFVFREIIEKEELKIEPWMINSQLWK